MEQEQNKEVKLKLLESLITYYQNKKQEEEIKYRQYTEQLSTLSQQYEELRINRETVRGAYTAYEQSRRDIEQQIKELKGENTIDGQITTDDVLKEVEPDVQSSTEDSSESNGPAPEEVKQEEVKQEEIDPEQVTKMLKELENSEKEKEVVQQTTAQPKADDIPDYLKQ